MINFNSNEEHANVYLELINSLPSVQSGREFYNLGIATVITSLLDWCNELNEKEIGSVTSNEIRNAFKAFYEYEPSIKKYIERLKEDYK